MTASDLSPTLTMTTSSFDVDDGAGQDLAGLDLLAGETLLEELLERFGHWVIRAAGPIGVYLPHGILPIRVLLDAAWLPACRPCRCLPALQRPRAASGNRSRASSMTRPTTSSMVNAVESTTTASGTAISGATARVVSRRSRSAISAERAARLPLNPFPFNCLWRLRALSSGLAVRKILSPASRKTIDPMSRPSATSPGARANARWRPNRADRTGCKAATLEAASPVASARSSRVTSLPASSTRSPPVSSMPKVVSRLAARRAWPSTSSPARPARIPASATSR